jgi:hypothetical protein
MNGEGRYVELLHHDQVQACLAPVPYPCTLVHARSSTRRYKLIETLAHTQLTSIDHKTKQRADESKRKNEGYGSF